MAFADKIASSFPKVGKGPSFSELMPFIPAWETLLPYAERSASTLINPEALREYDAAQRNYMAGMAGSGGGMFGRSWGGLGSLQAEAERQRQAQIQDMLNLYREGFSELFYEPSREAWTKGSTQIGTKNLPEIPTWNEFVNKYIEEGYGEALPIPELESISGVRPATGAGVGAGVGGRTRTQAAQDFFNQLQERFKAGRPEIVYDPTASPFVGVGGALTNYQRPMTYKEKERYGYVRPRPIESGTVMPISGGAPTVTQPLQERVRTDTSFSPLLDRFKRGRATI